MSEKLRVKWLEHVGHFKTSLGDVLDKQRLCDVTITSEGKMFKAHQLILSMCSPYFEKIFTDLPKNNYPTIFFKDISAVEIELLLSFVYKGEVVVPRNIMATFLKTCESLQIEGIFEENTNSESNNCNESIQNNSLNSDVFYSVHNTEENTDNTREIMSSINSIIQDIEDCSNANNITKAQTKTKNTEVLNHNLPETHSDKDVTNDFLQKDLDQNILNICHKDKESTTSETSFVFPISDNNNQNNQNSSSQALILDESPMEIVVLSDDDNCDKNYTSGSKMIESNMKTGVMENNLNSDEIEKLSTCLDITDHPSNVNMIDDIEEFLDMPQSDIGVADLSNDSETCIPVRSRINRLIYNSDDTVNNLEANSHSNVDNHQLLAKMKLEAIEKAKSMSVLLERPHSCIVNKNPHSVPVSHDHRQTKRACYDYHLDSSSDDDFRLVIDEDHNSPSNNESLHDIVENREECNNQNEILVRKNLVRNDHSSETNIGDTSDEYVSKVFNSVTEVPKHLLKQFCVQCKRCIKKNIFKKHCHKHAVEFSNSLRKKGKKKPN